MNSVISIQIMASFRRGGQYRQSKMLSTEEKWKILFNQQTRKSVYSAQQYCDHIRKYLQSLSGQTEGNSGSRDERPMSYLLRKLKVDLQMSFQSFVQEFLREPLLGIGLLLATLKAVQKCTSDFSRATAKVKAINSKRLLTDEHDCLLCLKFALREQEATNLLLDESYGLECVASALMSSFTKSRLVALEIMSLVLTDSKGFSRNLDCFTYFRLKNCEPVRFRFLVSMLMSTGSQNVAFQVCCMKFINSLLAASPNMNSRVFLQNELITAGLDADTLKQSVDTESSLEHIELGRELTEFHETFVDVDALIEYRSSLETTNDDLQKQLFVLQEEVQSTRNTSDIDSGDASMKSKTGDNSAHPKVPDPPPPPPCTGPSRKPNTGITFPFLYWKPLNDVQDTIFQTLRSDNILHDEDLDAFEAAFRLESRKPLVTLKKNQESRQLRHEKKMIFLERSRAHNLVLARRKVGLAAEDVKTALDQYDYEAVDADSAELLSRFIPTETELRDVMSLTCNYEELAEAEQLIVQLVSVSDLEGKLSCIAFMNQFQRKVDALAPELNNIQKSSSSLLNCERIKKVFEIILLLGNYANTNKCGSIHGFHFSCLSSLKDMKSSDKTQTLVDFIVRMMARNHPDILHWYQDIDLLPVAKGSFARLTSLVQELDEGIRMVGDHMNQTSSGHSERLATFYEEGEERIWKLRRSCQRTHTVYTRACSTFGENSENIEPSELFGHFKQFVNAYKGSLTKLMTESPSEVVNRPDQSEYAQPAVETSYDSSTEYTSLQVIRKTPTIDYVNADQREEFPAYTHDLGSERTDDLSYCDLEVAEALRNHCESETDGLLCDCCFKETGECALANNQYGNFPTKRNSAVENWIVCNNKAMLETSYRAGDELPLDYGDDINNNVHDVQHKIDTESYDSAFFGSDANVLKSSGRSSQEDVLTQPSMPRSSTPYTCMRTADPIPDYSRCPSPAGSFASKDTYSSELSKILTEFEGNLNQYESEVSPTYRRFYTVKSIIYL
ncbi:formin-like protein 1 isoform X2 [Mizuhopecten yessoensis]|uniref:formin-like protein 1 isoform X2 n=1 Tax=Mizuhopecten yessoensis TaxID=6573 RepID=UPI000B459E36|nr:formin-like protein 1 isoform X2 [Mizuhopecten yessoensis]